MFEAAIGDGAEKLGLEQEVAEPGRMDTDIAAFLIDAVAGTSKLAFLPTGSRGGLVGVELLVGVIDEILLGRHC